jgi:hypothetical protein
MTEFSPKKRTYLASRFKRNLEAAGFNFLRRQNMLSSETTLDADVVVKALNGSLDAAAQSARGGKSTSRKKTSGTGVEEVEKEVRFDPNGTRDPGQVLKLHVTAQDLENPGDNWGWVDRPKPQSPEKRRANMQEALQWRASRPKIRVRSFEQDPRTGKPILDTAQEIDIKSLGRTIKEILPGTHLAGRAARGLGLIVDADGKFRCPPGTPAANQFTDSFGTNCFKPVAGMRSAVGRIAGSLGRHSSALFLGDPVVREKKKNDLANRRAAEELAGGAIGSSRSAQRAMKRRNKAIQRLKDKFNITAGPEMNEDMWGLLEALAENDFPDLDWKGIFTSVYGESMWEDGLTVKQNVEALRAKLIDDMIMFTSHQTKTSYRINRDEYDRGTKEAMKLVDELVARQESAMRGVLGTMLHKAEHDPAFANVKVLAFRAWDPTDEYGGSLQSYWGTDGEVKPLYGKDVDRATGRTEGFTGEGMGVEVLFNPTAMALRPFMQMGDYDEDGNEIPFLDRDGNRSAKPPLIEISTDGRDPNTGKTEGEKWEAIHEFLLQTAKINGFVDEYATDISAAAHGGSLEMYAAHIAYHEFAHVKQYAQISQRVLEAFELNGGEFKIWNSVTKRFETLTTKPEKWNNGQWADAIDQVMSESLAPGAQVDFPPIGVEAFEGSMLHIFAGKNYQNYVQNWLAQSGGRLVDDLEPGEELPPGITVMIMEGMADIAALRDMGVIEGDDIDEMLDWMDDDIDEARLGIAEVDIPHRPRRVDELADMGEPPWETADDLPPGYVVTPSGQIVPTGSERRKAGGNPDAIRDAIARAAQGGVRSERGAAYDPIEQGLGALTEGLRDALDPDRKKKKPLPERERPAIPMRRIIEPTPMPTDSIIWDPDHLPTFKPKPRDPDDRPGPDGSGIDWDSLVFDPPPDGRPGPRPKPDEIVPIVPHVFDPDALRELVDKRPPRTDADAWEAWTSSVRDTPFGTSFLSSMSGGGGGGGNREQRISDIDKELLKNRARQDRLQRMTEERQRRDREPELKPEFLPFDPYGPIRDDDDRLPRRPGRPAWEYPESDPRWRPQPLMMDDFWDVEPIRPIPLRMAEITEEHQQLKTARSVLLQERKQLIRERNPLSREGMRSIKTSRTSDDPDVAKNMQSRNEDVLERTQETAFNAPDGWGDKYTPDRQYAHMPPIQNRKRSLENHHQKLEESLTDLEELSRVGQIWGPNDDVIEIDPQVSEFMSTRTREEVGKTIAKAAMTWHRGFDRRPRVALDIEEFDNLVTNGTHSRPDIPEGDNSAVAMRKYYDLRNGFDINTPTSDRPISGHLYHATHDDTVNDLITSLDGPNLERLPDFFDPQGPAPWGDSAQMGGDIDLVLRPETSNRTHYGFGDAMARGAIPVPMNSNNPDEILAANTPRWNQGTEDGPFSNTKKMHNLLKAGITGNYRDLNPDGEHHEAQILGGVELNDVEFVRYPVNKLNWKTRQLTDRDIGSKDKSTHQQLQRAGFTKSEIDYFYTAIREGRISGLHNVNWLRQNIAAREANKRFQRIGLDVKFTNSDGIDLLNVDTFLMTGVSAQNAAEAIRQRITMEIVNNAKELLVDLRRELKPSRNDPAGVLV